MNKNYTFTVIIEKEDNMYVAVCTELDIASQGNTIIEAKENLKQAIELFIETADPSEVESRTTKEQYISTLEVAIG